MTIQIPTTPRSVKAENPEPEKLRSVLPESEELRSVVDILEPQREVSVVGHPKNCLYIASCASIHILFNQGRFGGLIQPD